MSHDDEPDASTTTWNGIALQLQVQKNVNLPQTPNGTMVFAYFNMATQNNHGQLSLTSGGAEPTFLPVPALQNMPLVEMANWKGNNLSVTNISANAATPIWIAAYGPGTPGQTPLNLPTDGSTVPLLTTQSAQGTASPQYMQLVLSSNSPTLCIFAIVGGPPVSGENNGYVIAVNAQSDTGPNGPTPPAGYYATTASNTYTFPFNWGSSLVYVVNMSPSTSSNAEVVLRKL